MIKWVNLCNMLIAVPGIPYWVAIFIVGFVDRVVDEKNCIEPTV